MTTAIKLTDEEGRLLALLAREESITAYQVMRAYERSPVTNFSASKGKVYSIIARLKQRGLVTSVSVESDGRGTERLTCTPKGRKTVTAWVLELRSSYLLLDDPIRTKIQSFDLLTREQQIEWLATARAMLAEKLESLEAYGEIAEVPFKEFVHDGAVTAIRARMEWLDRVISAIVRMPRLQRSTPARRR